MIFSALRINRNMSFLAFLKVRNPRQGILRCALLSRCLLVVLSAVSNFIIPDHDATDVFIKPVEGEDIVSESPSLFDNLIEFVFGGLVRWDAHYFLHIAEHGYVFEKSLAFFPLFPLSVRFLSSAVRLLFGGSLTESSILLLSATLINLAAFLIATHLLYKISLLVLKDTKVAYTSAIIFCFNPASIFFTAPYSEALYVLLTFSGIYCLVKCKSNIRSCLLFGLFSCILFGLSSCTRSNGIISVGFIVYKHLELLSTVIWPTFMQRGIKTVVLWLASFVVFSLVVLFPFLVFQKYSFNMFCTPKELNLSHVLMNYAVENSLILPSLGGKKIRTANHWCHARVPLAYSYVQSHYWNVGFLNYFTLAQIPNFLLACPIVFLVMSQGVKFFSQHKVGCFTLGLTGKCCLKVHRKPVMPVNMFVFIVHAAALTLFCVFFIHVQVTTRMIFSASPVPYWFGAYVFHSGFIRTKSTGYLRAQLEEDTNDKNRLFSPLLNSSRYINSIDDMKQYLYLLKNNLTLGGKLIVLYCFFYFVIGTVLFSNFLPWT